MVEEVTDSDQDETVDDGLEEEHFVFGEVHQPYWQRFCRIKYHRVMSTPTINDL